MTPESETDLRLLLENVRAAIVVHDGNGRVILTNPMAQRLLGQSEGSLLNRELTDPAWHLLDESGEELEISNFPASRILATGTSFENQIVGIRRPGGDIVWVLVNGAPEHDGEGKVSRVIVSFVDITAQRKAEAKARDKISLGKDEWERTFDAVPDLVCIVDEEHQIRRVNRAMAERSGLKPQDLIGTHCWTHVHGGECPPEFCPHTRTLEDQKEHFEEMYSSLLDGWFRVSTTPLHDKDGDLVGSVHVMRDITKQRNTEQELRKAESTTRELQRQIEYVLGATKTGLNLIDSDYNVRYVDPEWQRTYGDPADRKCYEYFLGHDEPCEECGFRQALETGGPVVHEQRIPGEGNRPVMVTSIPYQAEDGEWLVAEVNVDISELKSMQRDRLRVERRLQETQKLDSLGILAGGIAHDFNNLLAGILGYADLAAEEFQHVPLASEYLKEIEVSTRKAADLCQQMLAFAGGGRFVAENIELPRLVEDMAPLLKTAIDPSALLNLHIDAEVPPIRGDSAQIRQILLNLVVNASEALVEKRGVITARTGVMTADKEYLTKVFLEEDLPEGVYVTLEVSDTGTGMDEETSQRIFEPFFTTKFLGRGLGLSAVLGIVRSHRGAIKVYTEEGVGTSMKVLLPLEGGVEDSARGAIGPVPDEEGWSYAGTVLLVDDDETVLAVGKRMLERIGAKVITCSNGVEALATYREGAENIDCVVTDFSMPGMDGETLFRHLRDIDPGQPVIMTSGFSERDITAGLAGRRLNAFIPKPYGSRTLREALRGAVEKGED